jgi:hypothetical protein
MEQNRAWIAAVVAASGLGVAAVWLAMPSTEPALDEIEPVAVPTARKPIPLPALSTSGSSMAALDDRGAKAKRGKGKGKGAGAGKAKGKRVEPPELDDETLEERAALRDEMRLERVGSLADRLAGYSIEAGWDPETADRVAEVMLSTTDKIGRNLERVDRGETEWPDIRDNVRDYRLDQAKRVRHILGDEEFDQFVQGMELERFMGERPIRARSPDPPPPPPPGGGGGGGGGPLASSGDPRPRRVRTSRPRGTR